MDSIFGSRIQDSRVRIRGRVRKQVSIYIFSSLSQSLLKKHQCQIVKNNSNICGHNFDLIVKEDCIQECLFKVINDPIFDLVVTLCIILNTVFLAVEHHGMSVDLQYVLDMGNKVSSRELITCQKLKLFYSFILTT